MPDLTNLASLLPQVEDQLKKLKSIVKWKGNHPPKVKHFPPESITVDGGILPNEQRLWVSFTFEDEDVAGKMHTVKATMMWDEPGTPGGADVITYDGVEVEADDFVLGKRVGLDGLDFYTRAVFEFRGTINGEPFHIRFDGDVA